MRVLSNIDTSKTTYLTYNHQGNNETVLAYINNVYNFALDINIQIIV
nr:MAG TPA: hypothetical protein [Crassvirales sp.]